MAEFERACPSSYGRFCSELVSLGTVGVMLTFGITLP